MAKLLDKFVSVVIIGDEHSKGVAARIEKTTALLKKHYANYEVVLVASGLDAEEIEAVKAILPVVPCIRVIRLAKPKDVDTAIFAGVEAAIGDHICILYNGDPIKFIPYFVSENEEKDIIFGVATNLHRKGPFEKLGAKLFYWYNRRYLKIDIPRGSTYYVCINRNVANALTSSDRTVRHFRHLAKLVGFSSSNYAYILPDDDVYSVTKNKELMLKGVEMISNYSSHPLRALTYFGMFAGFLNVLYAIYVVVINFSGNEVAKGWTTLSLQMSLMFFCLFLTIAVLAEYIGKILLETRKEPPYHIMQELSSTISLADETRRNVTK